MTELERAIEQIAFARRYTIRLLDGIEPPEWFRIPTAGVSHIAWQVGHLTFAQYRLALLRIRGRSEIDNALVPDEFTQLFGIKSTPEPDPSRYPSADAIRTVFDRVHARVMVELPACEPSSLSQTLDPPHSLAKTKLESLLWCGMHEMIHAGQIGLLRRQLGHPPQW
jgi:hypothetical protein